MKKYLRIFFKLFSISTKRYLENRLNALGSVLAATGSIFLQIMFIDLVFSYTPNLAGWKKEEIIFVVGLARILVTLFSLLFLRSINFLSFYIRDGSLDILLTKPVNSQFFVSLRLSKPYELLNLIPGLLVCMYAMGLMGFSYSFFDLILLLIGLVSGLFILYGIYFFIGTWSIWFTNFFSINSIFQIIKEPLNIPLDIFGKGINFILYFVVPLSFVVTVPAKIFLGKSPEAGILLGALIAFFLVWLSNKFWNYALKYYTSASS